MLADADADRVVSLLERLRLPTFDRLLELRAANGRRAVLAGIDEFREHLGGELTLMMLEGIGAGHEVRKLDEGKLLAAIDWLAARAERGAVRPRGLDSGEAPRAVAGAISAGR